MEQYIQKSAVLAEIDKVIAEEMKFYETACKEGDEEVSSSPMVYTRLQMLRSYIDTLEVKEVDISNISENLAEAYEYLDYTSTGNLAHNKPMVSARLKKAIRSLFDAGLFELTHDKQYRMENLGLKAQKGEKES